MAAGIFRTNGVYEAAFAGKPAWHKLGTVLPDACDAETMSREAHLNWPVEQVPLETIDGQDVPGWFVTRRGDTKQILGMVTQAYRVVQNAEAFQFCDSLVSEGGLKYESAGALWGGRRVWVLARMPSFDEIAEGDRCDRFVLFSTCHDGSGSLWAIPTSVRVVCQNTLSLATATSVGIRHTGDVKGKLDKARLLLSQFDAKFTLFRDNARLLATKQIEPAKVDEYLRELFPEPDRFEHPRAHANWQRDMGAVKRNMHNPRQTLPAIRGTWWAMLNAVTEHSDHYQSMDGKKLSVREQMFWNRLAGSEAEFKTRAMSVAVAMAS